MVARCAGAFMHRIRAARCVTRRSSGQGAVVHGTRRASKNWKNYDLRIILVQQTLVDPLKWRCGWWGRHFLVGNGAGIAGRGERVGAAGTPWWGCTWAVRTGAGLPADLRKLQSRSVPASTVIRGNARIAV